MNWLHEDMTAKDNVRLIFALKLSLTAHVNMV